MVEMRANGRLSERRIKVAVVNDYELVVQGVATMLRAFRDRIEVVEVDVRENPHVEVDVALFDTYGHRQLGLDRVAALVRDRNVGAVAVYTGHSTSDQCDAVLTAGARGLLAKSMQASALAEALIEIADGRQVVSEEFGDADDAHWPGEEFGLTSRESEVAALLAQGLSNKELAAALWISENTVKTHLKGIFQKTTATSRTQAIVRIAGDAQFARLQIA
jgi:two-component system, NarL family, response regulator LiaR